MAEIVNKLKRLWLLKNQGKSDVERPFVSVRKAAKMGVLYHADKSYSQLLIHKLSKWCEDHHIKLMAMGYVNAKELVGDYSPHRNSDFFCNAHLNRFKLPIKSEFERFTNEKLDFLLNLYCEPSFPLMGISSFSDAHYRVGTYLPEYDFCFDLMLKTDTKDVMVLTDEILTYLINFGDGKV